MQRRLMLVVPALLAPASLLADAKTDLCEGSKSCGSSSVVKKSLESSIGDIANTVMYLAGALAVIVIIFGGIRYVTSTGDAGRIKQAKDTILYGIVGLAVAILAYAIVRFVAARLT